LHKAKKAVTSLIYGLWVYLPELIDGEPPFLLYSPKEVISRVANEASPRAKNMETLSEELKELIERCLREEEED
jgi:serine/threonine protein kinase